MKYKVGDKVKVVKVIDVVNEQTKSYIGKDAIITGCLKDGYTIDIDKGMFSWYEGELELIKDKEENSMINEEIIKDIAEVIKTHNLGVSVSEKDGKIIVEPLKVEEEFKPLESGIYNNKEDDGVSVVFGGRIHVAVGTFKPNAYCIGLQELNGVYECGAHIEEEWMKNRPTVNLVINNKNSIRILRDALDIVEKKLNKE